MHYFMFLRFQEHMLINRLMYFQLDRKSTAKIVDLNEAEKKISLSMKALEQPEEAAEETDAE